MNAAAAKLGSQLPGAVLKRRIASAKLDRAVLGRRAMIQILLIAAAMLLAPASVRANAVEIVRLHPAELQPGGPFAPGTIRAGPLVAQNTAGSTTIAGTYTGKVDRRYINGEPQATRSYRLTMNPDMNTAKVLIYDVEGNSSTRSTGRQDDR
jgi:hypothetical protein